MRWQIVVTLPGTTFETLSAMDCPISAGKSRKKFSKSLGEAERTEHAPWHLRHPPVLTESRLRRRCGTRQQIGHRKIYCMPME
jgi:hypothetical protein